MSAHIRPDLSTIPAYVPGRNHPDAVKLASNETTFGPLPSAAKAIAEAAEQANRYPDNQVTELRAALAKFLDVTVANVAVGCGSVALCQELVQITCDAPTDEVVFAWRSFEAYPIVTQVGNATAVPIPLAEGHLHDLDAMADAVTERTKLIFVCNPNNPTGTAHGRAELERFLDRVPAHVLVVLDEAYYEYLRLTPESRPDGVEIGRTRPNVVVLRTFSKAYGLAGLRVGYAVGAPEVITALLKVHIPFSVNRVAQAAAIASLEARGELLDRTDVVVEHRRQVSAALVAAGYEVPSSEANFVWLPLGERSTEFAEASAAAGVLVRPFAGDGVRVTIGAPHENEQFLAFATDPETAARFR
ncbi:histidinol-phosphate transaminase [Nocardia asteroides NBRC 15531]|uniref:Aromatic amino acid aminotransferase n=1 Tax=Nocardia asteroides NBRC 15531 TaxID=1110697 RepID=U5E574_NOCAS|nr:histidinol-phosphate transaminase [Nocardia asteroides]TLF68884.1 histidinol-phosphate transaminase [Nocardia asteroides NBRC 15531]UGT48350.1 histidinol-phosphate transaminase [Nocardia asteroides]SFL56689.1 histidinol-phosphate aminotransferase [Nocardia asteroides]VEG32446.1 Putative phenylalanine aminotransferase [Nocardia asteroides]GAD84842.1 histidinol-phosphate aminotransferase [Nocardia asteroides NBRC 15531]